MKVSQRLDLFLKDLPIFETLSRKDLQALLDDCSLEMFNHRHTLQRSGDPHHHLYVVVTGKLEMVATSKQGDEFTMAVFGPKSMSSWVALFLDSNAHRSLVAMADTRVLAIPVKPLKALLERYPRLYQQVLRYEGRRFRAALDITELVLNPDRTKRLATQLMMLIQISGDNSKTPRVLMTHQQLQKIANCSRQVLHQNLKKLQELNLIKQAYGHIEVVDITRLQAFGKD